jgi:putative solute:sodium symporter small subunit
MTDARRHVFWARTKRLTAGLLAVWLLLNLVGPWFARDLNGLTAFGFPLGFWVAAQGALLLYLVIIVVYVWRMDRLEARYLEDEKRAGQEGPGAGSA